MTFPFILLSSFLKLPEASRRKVVICNWHSDRALHKQGYGVRDGSVRHRSQLDGGSVREYTCACSPAPCQEAGGRDDAWETRERALGRNPSLTSRPPLGIKQISPPGRGDSCESPPLPLYTRASRSLQGH